MRLRKEVPSMNNKIYKISLAAVFAALIYVATMFFTIPLPGNGYANLVFIDRKI